MLNRLFVVTLEQRCAKQDKYQIAIQVSPATSEAGTCVCPCPWEGCGGVPAPRPRRRVQAGELQLGVPPVTPQPAWGL